MRGELGDEDGAKAQEGAAMRNYDDPLTALEHWHVGANITRETPQAQRERAVDTLIREMTAERLRRIDARLRACLLIAGYALGCMTGWLLWGK